MHPDAHLQLYRMEHARRARAQRRRPERRTEPNERRDPRVRRQWLRAPRRRRAATL